MPSKPRSRVLAALGAVFLIILVPQLAGGAGSGSNALTVQPVPTPDPTPVPAPSECLAQNPQVVTGAQTSRFNPSVSGHLAVDARSASWTQVDSWPVSTTGSGSICWDGGSIIGTWTLDTTWDVFHHTGAFNFANPNSVVENVRVHNYGDAINVRDGAANWTVRGAHTSFIHDDCLQDDFLNSGVIADSLFDGCYVGISTRPSANDLSSDGRNNTLSVETSLLRLQPMPTVYKGPAPGHGGFFKWDETGRSPKLSLHNNIFRVDQTPNHGSLGLPSGYQVSCSGNTIVWLGAGAFPEAASWLAQCPDTKIVTTKSTWDDAVAVWHTVGVRTAVASGFVLDGYGGLHPYATGGPPMPGTVFGAPSWLGWDAAHGVAISPNDPTWGLVVDLYGGLHPFGIGGPAPATTIQGAPYWAHWNIAASVALMPDGKSGLVLDGYGGLHGFGVDGSAPPVVSGGPYWPGWQIAKGLTILPDGSGGYVLDGYGGMHPFSINHGTMPGGTFGGPGFAPDTNARGVTMLADGSGGYIVDAFGGISPFSTTPDSLPPKPAGTPYWPGWKIAESIANL